MRARWKFKERTPAHGYAFVKGASTLIIYLKSGAFKVRIGPRREGPWGGIEKIEHERIFARAVDYHKLSQREQGRG